MKPFNSCPVCGGELIHKKVEKILKGGGNTAVVRVDADVCLHCGERLYSEESVRRFEEIRAKLGRGDTGGFTRRVLAPADFRPSRHHFQSHLCPICLGFPGKQSFADSKNSDSPRFVNAAAML